jgi:NAD(P)-dependent dehydrogenase (short-subunit alcohol dehydrogenase family)
VADLVAAARTEWGGVDVMVNSAAVRLQSPLTESSAADFAEVLRINLVGAFVLTKLVTGPMRERGGGSVIHIGSALGTAAAPFFSPYVASKGGLNAWPAPPPSSSSRTAFASTSWLPVPSTPPSTRA